MTHLKPLALCAGLAAVALSPALAQSSASYQVTESVINNGGDPKNGAVLSSASFSITLDAIGGAISGGTLAGSSYRTDVGFVQGLRPAGEVLGLRFTDRSTLAWQTERSTGTYRVYRGVQSALPGSYGTCQTPAGLSAAQFTDTSNPSTGQSFVYLVAARNRIDEEGTLGATSAGAPISNYTPCP